jgi:hypothetical protein
MSSPALSAPVSINGTLHDASASADLAVANPSPPSAAPRKRKVIIDTDAGCDDAIAILMALKDPNIDVVAITSVFGNVPQAQATGKATIKQRIAAPRTQLRASNAVSLQTQRNPLAGLVCEVALGRTPKVSTL